MAGSSTKPKNCWLSEVARLELARGNVYWPGGVDAAVPNARDINGLLSMVCLWSSPGLAGPTGPAFAVPSCTLPWALEHQREQPSTRDSHSKRRGPGPVRSGCVRPLAEGVVLCWAAAMAGEQETETRVVGPQTTNRNWGLGC
jgi:hypothetical protein